MNPVLSTAASTCSIDSGLLNASEAGTGDLPAPMMSRTHAAWRASTARIAPAEPITSTDLISGACPWYAPRPQQRLLHGVVGVVQVAEHAVDVHVQRAPMRAAERDEGLLVAAAGGGEQPGQAEIGVGHGPPSSVHGDAS